MCYAILKVGYRNDKERKNFDVPLQENLEARIREHQSKPEVMKVEVFVCNHVISKKESWDESPYKAPVKE